MLFAFTPRCKLYLGQNCQARGGCRIAAQVTQVAMRDIATDHAHTAILFHNRSRHKKVAMIGDHSILNSVYDCQISCTSHSAKRDTNIGEDENKCRLVLQANLDGGKGSVTGTMSASTVAVATVAGESTSRRTISSCKEDSRCTSFAIATHTCTHKHVYTYHYYHL